MIFVYPAIVSSSVKPRIGVAVAKVLEQYFLIHLQEAFQNNDIRIVTHWKQQGSDYDKGTYGPLQLETARKPMTGSLILEVDSSNTIPLNDESNNIDQEIKRLGQVYTTLYNKYQQIMSGTGRKPMDHGEFSSLKQNQLLDARLKIRSKIDQLSNISDQLSDLDGALNKLPGQFSVNPTRSQKRDIDYIREREEGLFKVVQKKISGLENDLRTVDSYMRQSGTDKSEEARKKREEERKEKEFKSKEAREKRKEEEEKATRDLQQYETHGMYRVELMKGISLKPTQANLSVKIQYIGGPHAQAGKVTSPSGMNQEISVGTKVLPMRLVNFDKLEEAILDDYFSTAFQSSWKAKYRNFLRFAFSKIKQWTNSLIDIRSKMDPVSSNILLSSQGFVNSSSFERKSGSPSFYHYSAAIVIFEKDDLIREEGANFFLNKSQLSKMFKMGWNSFCILDSVNEEATFVSSVDGGYMHVIPYSYIFNTLGMDQVYKDMNDLQKRASPFRMSRGNFSNFIARMKRESRLLKALNLLQEDDNEGTT